MIIIIIITIIILIKTKTKNDRHLISWKLLRWAMWNCTSWGKGK